MIPTSHIAIKYRVKAATVGSVDSSAAARHKSVHGWKLAQVFETAQVRRHRMGGDELDDALGSGPASPACLVCRSIAGPRYRPIDLQPIGWAAA